MSEAPSYDYIIVGGGVAGLTLASRLSQILPDRLILVVEAGSDPTVNENVLHPAGYRALQPSEQAWTIPIASNPNLDNRNTTAYVGKALSGSAAINGGAWTRGPASDYNLWAETVGDASWSYESLVPYFKLTEKDQNTTASSGHHGLQGTITATSIISQHPSRIYPLRDIVERAFAESNVRYNPDMNNGQPNGLCENLEVWLDGRRQLPHQILDLSRLIVRDDCTVKRVVFSDSTPPRATGVELLDGSVLCAKQEVIVSAGTYHTPQLLMLSGIGPSDHLQRQSIRTILHNPAVGANLSDHLAVTVTLRLQPTAAEKGAALMHPKFLSNPRFLYGNPLDFIHFSTLATAQQEATLRSLNERQDHAALVCRRTAIHYENVVLYTPFPSNITGLPDQAPEETAKGDLITTTAIVLTTTSRGRVSLRSADPLEAPYVDSNMFSTKSDQYILREAVRKAMYVWTETPTGKATVAEEVVPDGFEPVLPGTSDEAINARIRHLAYTFEHPMSTCRMAKRPGWEDEIDGGVVDSQCRVFGVDGLRVVDASILPLPIAAHIQATVYALAEKMAAVVAGSSASAGKA